MNKQLTLENLVLFDYPTAQEKINELKAKTFRRNATKQLAQQQENLTALSDLIAAISSFDELPTYKKQLRHCNAWVYETDDKLFLKSWETVTAYINKVDGICVNLTDYIFYNIPPPFRQWNSLCLLSLPTLLLLKHSPLPLKFFGLQL